MAVKDVFKVELATESGFEDITSGILNVDIFHGTEVYEGPYQQIDTGQFSIVSRNPNLDPKVNPNLKFNSYIQFIDLRNVEEGKSNVFFGGWVTDIDVQYQREDDPIITITGTDIFGLLQRTVVTEDIVDVGRNWSSGQIGIPEENGPNFPYLLQSNAWSMLSPATFEYISAQTPGIGGATPSEGYLAYAPARYLPEVGQTLLEIINKYAQTNLNYFSVNHRQSSNTIYVYPHAKYNSFYWPPIQDPATEFLTYQFSSDPADGRPYETILINNGYNRVTNSITVSNETRTLEDPMDPYNTPILSNTTEYGPYIDSTSETQYGTTGIVLDTIIPSITADAGDTERYSRDVFEIVGFVSDEIQRITFDNGRYEDIQNDSTYSFSQLNQFVRIKHKVSNTETIDRFYDISGIGHSISPDKWEMSFTFKPSQQEIAFTYQGQLPTIQMNSLTGDNNFNFTATITDYPIEDIDNVIWCLNGTNSDVTEQWFATVGPDAGGTLSRYKDGLQRTGLTQTWNFDDDGILAGPDFPTGGYGSGYWYVIPYIFLKNGWVIAPNVMLTVGTPEVTADFLWSQNLINNFGKVTFTDDSHNNEIDEPDSYLWDFGDGTISTEKNPTHVYDPAPTETEYDVSLTVFAYGSGGTKVYNTKTETITLAQPTMTANFTSSVFGAEVTFTNTSTNVGFEEPDAYFWDFGDGTTSTQKNPFKVYAAVDGVTESFSVTLTTRNIWEQTATVTKTVTISGVNASGNMPLRYLRFTLADYYGADPVTQQPYHYFPVMSFLRAKTSESQANLSYLKPMVYFVGTNSQFIAIDEASVVGPLNLTRDPSITPVSQYGIMPNRVNQNLPTNFDIIVDFQTPTNYAYEILLNFKAKQDAWWRKMKVYATESTSTLTNPSDFTWFEIGQYEGPYSIASYGSPLRWFPDTKSMVATRPMPLNVPYFYYSFDNTTASFISKETADSYAWNFGDGTTSTLKDPVHTFPRAGTYNVTLEVTNGGVVTRTTTEPVIVRALCPFDVRYVKFVQNLHTGTHAYDTPIVFVKAKKGPYQLPLSKGGTNAITRYEAHTYPMIYRPGNSTSDGAGINILVADGNKELGGANPNGLRVKSQDASFRTEWYAVIDLLSPQKDLEDFVGVINKQTITGFPATVAAGISYSVYVTDATTSSIDPNTVTWTKIGDITPTDIPTSPERGFYSIVPS